MIMDSEFLSAKWILEGFCMMDWGIIDFFLIDKENH